MLSVCGAHSAFARTHYAGQETTRAIRAVQMSAGDKDRSASTGSVVRSRRPDHVTRQEHEHCTADMLAELAKSSACDILGRESRVRQVDLS